jgi:hypothetical protein
MIHGIALLWLRETDSAHFPSDVNPLVVIFLLDYRILHPQPVFAGNCSTPLIESLDLCPVSTG